MSDTHTFYSEFLEDMWLKMHGNMPEKGVFVDCGCYHPEVGSNTAYWRNRGWTGLAIDGNQNLAEVWAKYPNVAFVNAVIGTEISGHFEVNPTQPSWSRFVPGEGVTGMRTLNSICEEHKISKIDLLSIDLEGMEYAALLTLDLDKYQPETIIAEFDTEGIGKDYSVLEYLLRGDYLALHMTRANVIYRRVNKRKLPVL
jgi:hypothetical protein